MDEVYIGKALSLLDYEYVGQLTHLHRHSLLPHRHFWNPS